MWSVKNCSGYNLVNTGGLSVSVMWIIRLGHFNILLCETSIHNVKEYVIHPKDSFNHRPVGQQRLVLLRRQKRKPQAYPSHDTVQGAMPGSESSGERTLAPSFTGKCQEYKIFVNSGKSCCKKCYLELVKGRSSWWGLGEWLAAGCCYFRETIVSPHQVLVFLSRVKCGVNTVESCKSSRVSAGQALHLPLVHTHLRTPAAPTVYSLLPLQEAEGANCLSMISEMATEQVVAYHSCPIASTKNSNKTSGLSLSRAFWRNVSHSSQDS